MKSFKQVIMEAGKDRDAETIMREEITRYINKLKKSLPVDVQKAIYLTQKYNITSAQDIENIRSANKSKLKDMVDALNIPLSELEDLWSLLKSMKKNYKVMPQFLSKHEREMLEKGKLALDDVTIDLTSASGRNAAATLMVPTILTIAKQFMETGANGMLTKQDLISAGNLGLANALNDWKGKDGMEVEDEDGKKQKIVSFRTYAGYRIQQAMRNEVDANGHSLSGTNWYATKKAREENRMHELDALSLDAMDLDKIAAISGDAKTIDARPGFEKAYKKLAQKFSTRDLDIFYRFFGLNGYQKEKSKDIAKSYGMSEGNIRNSVINKILKFLKTDVSVRDILQDILDMYTESLLLNNLGQDKNKIIESLIEDDIYMLLEDITKWNNGHQFTAAYNKALGSLNDYEQKLISGMMENGFDAIDKAIRKDRGTMIQFLRHMEPTSTYRTDGDIITAMTNLSEYAHQHNIRF